MKNGYSRWITNCSTNDAFGYLMKYCNENPEKQYYIDRPAASPPMTFYLWHGDKSAPFVSNGFSVEELEEMDSRGIYEWIELNN